jgi:hypothetical protein
MQAYYLHSKDFHKIQFLCEVIEECIFLEWLNNTEEQSRALKTAKLKPGGAWRVLFFFSGAVCSVR